MSFVPALLALRGAAPDRVIGVLHQTFTKVSQLDDDEVVVAYQTVHAVAEEAGLLHDRMVQRLLHSIKVQMIGLMGEYDVGGYKYRFEATVGEKLYFGRF